eukprot:7887060-Pyramimonas_sp.AAC.1
MAQYSCRRANIASDTGPRGLKSAPRRFHMHPKAFKDHPKRQQSFKHLRKINVLLPSRGFASEGLLGPQDGRQMAQGSAKMGPRQHQDCPKSAQERTKSGPIWS